MVLFHMNSDLKKIDKAIKQDFKAIDRAIKMDVKKLIGAEIREEKRVPIPAKTKKAVYERAKGRCERCGRPLKMSDSGANFHHLRKPTTRPRPENVQFLCAFCHKQYGHEFKSRTIGYDPLTGKPKKKIIVIRKKVRKDPTSPYWKEKTKITKEKTKTRKTQKTTKARKKKRTKRKHVKPEERLLKQIRKDFLGS